MTATPRIRWFRVIALVALVCAVSAGAWIAERSRSDSPRVATTAQFKGLRFVSQSAWSAARADGNPDDEVLAEIVATRRHSAFGQANGDFDPAHDPIVYLVQMQGRFTCDKCTGPFSRGRTTPVPSARVLSIVFDPESMRVTDSGLTDQAGDLSLMGHAYRLPTPEQVT